MPMPPLRRRWIAVGAAVAALAVVVLAFDSNWLQGPVERAVSARMGRTFEIGGELDIVPRWQPRLIMTDVRLENPEWAIEPDTLRLPRVEVSLRLLPLLAGRVVLPEVVLSRPVVDLERSREGANNWSLQSATEEEGGAPPVIERFAVDEGVITFHDPKNETALRVQVQTLEDGSGGAALQTRASGRYKGEPLEAAARSGSIVALAERTEPYPVDVEFRIGKTAGRIRGTVSGVLSSSTMDLRLDVRGDTLSELFPLIRVSLPPTPPYHITGRLQRQRSAWRFHDFTGRVGDSDLAGDADIAYGEGRTRVTATLRSRLLDLDDLAGFIGATPATGPGETASERQRREAAEKKAKPTVLPDLPIRLERVQAMDADVRFTGERIRGQTPLENVETHIVLEGGVMTLRPLNFGVAGGKVVSTLVLDGRNPPAVVDAEVEFRRLDLRRLFPENPAIREATGLLGGRTVLKGRGNSFAEVMATSNGTIGLAMSGGQVSNLVVELAGLDLAETLRLLFRGDKPVGLRCAVADLEVRDGIVHSRSTILDTTDTNIRIDGQVNLRGEQLDLTLHPLPKDYSPVSLRSPLHVRGTFKKPEVRPDEELLVRGGVAAVLGALAAPIGALVGLIETGPGDDADCDRLVDAVEKNVRKDLPEAE